MVHRLAFVALFVTLSNGQDVQQHVRFATPSFRLVRSYRNSTLHETRLNGNENGQQYELGPAMVVTLRGVTRTEIGEAYGTLLGEETLDSYTRFMESTFPQKGTRMLFEVLDLLLCSYTMINSAHTLSFCCVKP